MSVTSSLSLEDYLGKLDETTTQNEYFLALFVVLFSECGFYLLEETSFGNNKKLQFIPPSQWMVREDTYEIKLVLRGLPNMELSDRFKNELVMGVRSDILTEAGITNPSLKGLPIELKFKILAMLDARSLTRLSQCSHQFNMLCKEPWLWQRLLEKDFGEKSHENWLMAYRTKYMESKTRMINIEHMFNHRPGYASAWVLSLQKSMLMREADLLSDFYLCPYDSS
ncbi:F-box only protein 7-like isoform X4 [Polistes fuscatus]|uniref:F-box only protein 7-like isoform X4 n=1 Tax=Polistes fuscatus TaxID=30207 RepID=UPI001CAA2F70|nr:F-box only protein 7-like isoform X4 [Polistes fuscatus]